MLQKILFLLTVRRMLLLEVSFIAAIPSSEKTPDRFLVFLFILFFIASSGIFSSKGSSSSDESSDSATLQAKEEGACKHARKAVIFALLTILEPSAFTCEITN